MTISIKHDLPRDEYFIDPINSQDNERIVELKLAMDWYEKVFNAGRADNILEIGNVLGFYGFCEHECIDKFATIPDISPAGTVDNIDALEYDYTGRDVICVSDTNAPTTHWVNVLSNTGSVVDVSDGTAIVETDGD